MSECASTPLAEHGGDVGQGELNDAFAADGANDAEALRGVERLVELVGQRHVLGRLGLAQVAPRRLAAVARHPIERVAEPRVRDGQVLQVQELLVRHPVERLLRLPVAMLAHRLVVVNRLHELRSVRRRDDELALARLQPIGGRLHLHAEQNREDLTVHFGGHLRDESEHAFGELVNDLWRGRSMIVYKFQI